MRWSKDGILGCVIGLKSVNVSKWQNCLLDLLYPRRCPVCEEIVMPKGQLICPSCLKKLHFIKEPICKRCGKELLADTAEYCFDCTKHKRSFESGLALVRYDAVTKDSMAQIKYKNKREYLDFYIAAIAGRYARQIKRMKADALIPVPLHPSRRRKRGFNQAEVLARGIGRKLGIPVCTDLLIRIKKTAPQKQLNSTERLKNLVHAFEASEAAAQIHTVILVDDIYTTGSTIEACARVLKKAGIDQVFVLTVCIGQTD